MAAPQIASLPPYLELTGGMQIVVTAVDATTGAAVTGVAISPAYADVEYVDSAAGGPADVPLFLQNFTTGDMAA